MKSLIVFVVFSFMTFSAQAVSARNLQPLIESIALLKLYMGYVKKGYDIADKGLQTVKDIKNGEFNLHDDYFNSLKKVNPQLKHYQQIETILRLQTDLLTLYNRGRKKISSGEFDDDESRYLIQVYNNLLEESGKDIDELTLIITDGKLEMKDDERMKRIALIYQNMLDKYSFINHFNKQVAMIAQSRMKERNDIEYLKKVYNL